jgi:transcriptional regulator with PAS, ATPase and Fis domain
MLHNPGHTVMTLNPKSDQRYKRRTSIGRRTLANATEGIIMINAKNQIVQLNQAAVSLLRYEANELINQPMRVVIPKFNCSYSDPAYRNKYWGICTARKKGGDEFSAKIYVLYCENSPDASAFVFIIARGIFAKRFQ